MMVKCSLFFYSCSIMSFLMWLRRRNDAKTSYLLEWLSVQSCPESQPEPTYWYPVHHIGAFLCHFAGFDEHAVTPGIGVFLHCYITIYRLGI